MDDATRERMIIDLVNESWGPWEALPQWNRNLILRRYKDRRARFSVFMMGWRNGLSPLQAAIFVIRTSPDIDAGGRAHVRELAALVQARPREYDGIPTFDVRTGRVEPPTKGSRFALPRPVGFKGDGYEIDTRRGVAEEVGSDDRPDIPKSRDTSRLPQVQPAMDHIGYDRDPCREREPVAYAIQPPEPIVNYALYQQNVYLFNKILEVYTFMGTNDNRTLEEYFNSQGIVIFPAGYLVYSLGQRNCVLQKLQRFALRTATAYLQARVRYYNSIKEFNSLTNFELDDEEGAYNDNQAAMRADHIAVINLFRKYNEEEIQSMVEQDLDIELALPW